MTCIKACFLAGFFFFAVLMGGCAIVAPQAQALKKHPPADLPQQAELFWVPFYAQEDYQCGPTALATVLKSAGVEVTPEMLVDQVYLPARQGSLQIEMLATARARGMVAYPLAPSLEDVLREVAAQTPVVVLQNYGTGLVHIWHYAVVVGYDLTRDELVLRSGHQQRQVVPISVFEYTWKDSERWAMIAVPPARLPATATETKYAAAALALEKTGQIRAAAVAYITLLKRWPESITGLMGAGNATYALGDLRAAERVFRKATELYPSSVAFLNNLAQTLSDQGRHDEAVSIARRAADLGGPLAETSRATLESALRRQRIGAGITRTLNIAP